MTDTEFVEKIKLWIYGGPGTIEDKHRIFGLVSRGAEAADTITALRAEVETVGAMHREACELAKHRMQEITTLRAENEKLRAALQMTMSLVQGLIDNDPDEPISDAGHTVIDLWRANAGEAMELARAALAEEKKP